MQLLRRILVLALMIAVTATSSAAVTCAAECGDRADPSPDTAAADTCCGEKAPKPDEQRDEPSSDRSTSDPGPCLSMNCRTAMIAGAELDLVAAISPLPADAPAPRSITAQAGHDRIFHPPRA